MRRFLSMIIAVLLCVPTARAADGPLNLAPPLPRSDVGVYLPDEGRIVRFDLEAYLLGVVAAEMPVSYELEALKAQAVAARTYTVKKRMGGGCRSQKGADVCADSGCCQAYRDPEALFAHWGEGDERTKKLKRAVGETAGEIVTYDGQPIEAMYHASSGGHTEDVEAVYTQALPYLRGVKSDGEQDAPQFSARQTFTGAHIARAMDVRLTDAPLHEQIKIISRTASGRVAQIEVCGTLFTGTEFRRNTGLRSSIFDMHFSGESVTFDVRGFGHGVGLSQTGANAMAMDGAGYREILMWYYTDSEVTALE